MITIEYTDERCVFANKSHSGIPLLVNNTGFIKPACDYLRFRVTIDGIKPSSAKTYAEDLQCFFQYMEEIRQNWQHATDNTLLNWKNSQNVESKTINRRLDTVVSYYIWLETNNYISNVVKIPGLNSDAEFSPQITLLKVQKTNPHSKRTVISLKSPLRIKNASPSRILHTPTSDEISKIYAAISNVDPGIALRNNLLISWYRTAGLRRIEWLSLTVEQIPSWREVFNYYDIGEAHELLLKKTKNSKPRYVAVIPELLEETREYIEGPRSELVQRFSQKPDYIKTNTLFLSHKTGRAMTPCTISNLLHSLMKNAGVNATGHRIRATYLTELVEAELAAAETLGISEEGRRKTSVDWDLILEKVAQRAGHQNPETLRAYVNLARKRRDKNTGISQSVQNKQRKSHTNDRPEFSQHELDQHIYMHELQTALKQGRKKDAVSAAENLLKTIKSDDQYD